MFILSPESEVAAPDLDAIYARLENVYDPELDDSIVRLQFLDGVTVEGGAVTVRYKVPTFWCAPNFVFLMSADIRTEVLQVPGVTAVQVLVGNNCVADEVNQGVNAGRSFQETFPDDADDDLEALRRVFVEKGFLARQDVLLRRLRQAGLADGQILALCHADLTPSGEDVIVALPDLATQLEYAVPPGLEGTQQQEHEGHKVLRLAAGDLARYLHKRMKLGLTRDPDALLFTTLEGRALDAATLPDYLRRSRSARLNIAFNTTLCEGLLRATHMPERVGETASVGDALLIKGVSV